MTVRTPIKVLFYSLALAAVHPFVHAQEASQLGFTALQSQANDLVEQGQLVEALPLLKELVERVEAAADSDIKLDFPVFLIGTAHIQRYVASGQKRELQETLKWYDKLQNEFPDSPKIKDMLLKRIDVLRVLGRNDEATALMRDMLSGKYNFRLNYSEQTKLLKDLTDIYYGTGQLKEGLPYFGQLLEVSRDPEDRATAAAAGFEALFAEKRIDDAIGLLPNLARESEVRYRPRLNVALLKASDALVDAGRVNDAALILNLIKTTDLMIEFHESQIAIKQARVEQRTAFGNAEDEISKLNQEIKTLEANLKQLRTLPTLRNELLVRRARNYTKTGRRYEAFWMFYDLMKENPDDPQAEFFYYATFSNGLQLQKTETVITVGKDYRKKFPSGDYYSDVSGALAGLYRDTEKDAEFLELATNFLDTRPQDPVSPSLFAQWASFLIEREQYADLITQAAIWYNKHSNSIYEDAIFYWSGMSELQLGQYADAVSSFTRLIEKYPTSLYAEDGLLRKGAAQFYAQDFMPARDTLQLYVSKYPNGQARDQAYFFLGELENLAGNLELALEYLSKADELTTIQDVHNAVAFRMGTIYEALERYKEMASHFENYIMRFGDSGNLTRAVYELGRAFEYLMRPVDMLALYRENISKYAQDPANAGVDTLVEGYAEKYQANKIMLERTVALFDQLESDTEFRTQFVTDRGFLFEHFYTHQEVHQQLYNQLRRDPYFTPSLVDDLSPIAPIMRPYREQLAQYPQQSPEEFFMAALQEAKRKNDRITETRMLMGLYRLGVELDPMARYDDALIAGLTPRAILYIADYERNKRLDFAVKAWNQILINYPNDDATIVAYMRLADVNAEKGQYSDALNYLEQIATLFPGSPQVPAVILRQGDILSTMGRGQEARAKYQYILRVPDWRGVLHARALYQTGQSYMAENAFAEAHGFFERTFLGYPHLAEWSARAYLLDAEALIGMNAAQDARNTLNEAIKELSETAPAEIMDQIKGKLKELQP